jgi:hypothetical protein
VRRYGHKKSKKAQDLFDMYGVERRLKNTSKVQLRAVSMSPNDEKYSIGYIDRKKLGLPIKKL